ncbi:MAG TPA: hypothetical protein EYN89_05810 [Flavobacteriales bacterium]|nr:hypothetical protein [Flavobacteriales bacterium]
MSNFVLHNVVSVQHDTFDLRINDQGIYISILNATHTPPHLLIIFNGFAYSLSVNGFKTDKKLQELIRLIRAREIKALFVELVPPTNFIEDYSKLINHLIRTCIPLELGEVTCLFPIKEFCKVAYNLDLSKVEFIFDLLPVLERNLLIKESYSMNMDEDLICDGYSLKTYGIAEINDMIEDIQFKQIK